MEKLTVTIDTEDAEIELEVEYKVWPGQAYCHTQSNGEVGWPYEPPEIEWYATKGSDIPDEWSDQIERQIWDHVEKESRDEPEFDHERDYYGC